MIEIQFASICKHSAVMTTTYINQIRQGQKICQFWPVPLFLSSGTSDKTALICATSPSSSIAVLPERKQNTLFNIFF